MATLPLDVVAEILCRLPVDCILRFRCVSKSWGSLIDSPEFAKLHLNYSLRSNSNRWLILGDTKHFGCEQRCFYRLGIDSLNSPVVTPKQLKNPLKSSNFKTNILGSCNGLLLLCNSVDDVAIWNPSTGKYKKLPSLRIGVNNCFVKFGFGYDVVNDDYKVVRIEKFFCSKKESFSSEVKIYTLKSNSWKGIEKFPYYLRQIGSTYLNGALHWVATSEMAMATKTVKMIPLIVAFDLGTEKCQLVPPPPHSGEGFNVELAVLGGSLCAFYPFFKSNDERRNTDLVLDHVDIWVMKKYGVKDSWTKILSLGEPNKYIGHTIVPLAYSKSGDEVLVEQDNSQFIWTSSKDRSVKIVDIAMGGFRSSLHFKSSVYVGSLVHLSSSEDGNDRKKQYNQDKGGKMKSLKKRGDGFLSQGFKLKL